MQIYNKLNEYNKEGADVYLQHNKHIDGSEISRLVARIVELRPTIIDIDGRGYLISVENVDDAIEYYSERLKEDSINNQIGDKING